MRIHQLSVGPMDNNAYLVVGEQVVLVDAAAEPRRLLAWAETLAPGGIDVVVTTHRHHDHIGALAEVARATGAPCVAGAPDADAIADSTGVSCEPVWDGDDVAGLRVIGLVGHTPGGIALVVPRDGEPDALITGDSLFPGGVGKTHTPEQFASLLGDVTRKLFDAFADDVEVLPGHGKPTTLGAERPRLDEWRRRGW